MALLGFSRSRLWTTFHYGKATASCNRFVTSAANFSVQHHHYQHRHSVCKVELFRCLSYNFHLTRNSNPPYQIRLLSDTTEVKQSPENSANGNYYRELLQLSSEDQSPERRNITLQLILRFSELAQGSTKARVVSLITATEEFKSFCLRIEEEAASMKPKELLDSLENLQKLAKNLGSNDSCSKAVTELEKQFTLTKLNAMTMESLLRTLKLFANHKGEAIRKTVHSNAARALQQSVSNNTDFTSLLYHLSTTRDLGRTIISRRLLELQKSLSSPRLATALEYMIKKNVKEEELVSTLLSRADFDRVQWKKLMYLACTSSEPLFYCPEVKKGFTKKIERVVAEAKQSQKIARVFNLLFFLSDFLWDDEDVLDWAVTAVLQDLKQVQPHQLVGVLLTCARLDLQPDILRTKFSQVVDAMRFMELKNPVQWLVVVWCSLVLRQSNQELIASVLSETFIDRLLKVEKSWIRTDIKQRLLNIDAMAECEVKNYSGPRLSLATMDRFKLKSDRQTANISEELATVIRNLEFMAPSAKYFNRSIVTPFGTAATIDIELLLNASGTPQPLTEYQALWGPESESLKPVPTELKRVALKVLSDSDVTKVRLQPNGIQNLAFRYLKHVGYEPAPLNFFKFHEMQSKVHRVQFLSDVLKKSVQK